MAVLFLDCFVLELGCGSAGVVSGLPAEAQLLVEFATMLLSCHIGCIVLGLLCVGVRVQFS